MIDGGYGNNSHFLKELEELKLNYIRGLAKNRLATVINPQTGKNALTSSSNYCFTLGRGLNHFDQLCLSLCLRNL